LPQFFKTEIGNPPSNFIWDIMQLISIEWYQSSTVPMLYASVNSTQSTNIASDGRVPNDDSESNKTNHILYHSIDMKHSLLYVKFGIGLSIPFPVKSVSKKKWHFSWRMAYSFFKRGV
jgi:hypothetical protein